MISTDKILPGALYASIAVAVVVTAMLAVSTKDTIAEVTIAGERLNVIVADTPSLQEKGLSGRTSLGPNDGMLFLFPEPGFHRFWMKNMKIPIDIIWLDANRRIVDVWENATPESYPETREPRSVSLYVLEVNAGFYKKHKLNNGNVVELKLQ